jgi:gliding motility-associated-like protein
MRRIFTISFLFISCLAFAQPANDDCAGIIDLGEAPYCVETDFYSNVDATPSDIGNDNVPDIGDCFSVGAMQNDVWFSFIASDTIEDYLITVTGISDDMGSTAMIQPQLVIYRGDCEFDGLEALNCEVSDAGGSEVSLSLSGLDPGLPYFIRVSDWNSSGASNEGSFQLCIEEVNIWTPDEDITITTCSGELYDSGGPDGNYEPGQNYTVTIAPSSLPPGGCIFFNMEYYNVENPGDAFIVTDGATEIINSGNLTNFFDVAGGAGFNTYASNGSVNFQFTSDASVEFEGFYITWECSAEACPDAGNLTINAGSSYEEIETLLSTPYAQVTVDTIICDDGSLGLFQADDLSGLGIENGIALSSGSVTEMANPSTFFASSNVGFPGDEDLDTMSEMSGGLPSFDACIIELDVFSNTDLLTFDYRFGSEEYPNFVGSSFNDIFALLISEPGGPINDKYNMAKLPGSDDDVQINSVNYETNWEYYTSNVPANISSQTIAFGGLTTGYQGNPKYLTAAREVDPCNTYRLKFAVADRGDGILDSGVFVSEIRGSSPNLSGVTNIENMNYIMESQECKTSGNLIISVDSIPVVPDVYQIQLTGTADPELDLIIDLPDSIIISPTQYEFSFPYSAVEDAIVEGTEYLTVSLVRDYGCGAVEVSSFDIVIKEEVELDFVNIVNDTAFVCLGDSIEVISTGAEIFAWAGTNPSVINFNPDDEATTVITPTESTTAILFGYLAEAPLIDECRDVDSIQVIVIEPELEITTDDPLGICVGDTITLTAENNVGNNGLTWSPPTFLSSTTDEVVDVVPTNEFDQVYIARVELQGCEASDTISLGFDIITVPEIIDDQQLCESYPIELGQDVGFTTTTYEWLPDVYLDDNTSPNPVSNPEDTITYTFIATSENAFCADTSQVTIEVIEADIDILNPTTDSLEICLGDTISVITELTLGGTDLQWTPDNGTLSSTSSAEFEMFPNETTTYFATYTVGPCLVSDSIFVRVDSLPNLEIDEFLPFKDPYCQGDSFIIVSNIYQPINFPDMEHLWTSAPGSLSSDTLYNLVVIALESGDFTRVTTNRACVDSVSTYVEVIEPFLSISPEDPIICPGESVELMAVGPDTMHTFTWTEAANLSCDTCQTTIATPGGSETFNLTAVLEGCEDQASTTIFVTEITDPGIQDITICLDETVILNEDGPFDSGATYTWSTVDNPLLGTDQTLEITPTEQTTYFLLMEEGNCSEEYEITVDVINEPPTLSAGVDQVICIGESAELTVESSSTGIYTWEPGTLIGSVISVDPTVTTEYVVVGDYGCFEVEDTILVTVGQGFSIENIEETINGLTPEVIFEGDNIDLLATLNPENSDYTYTWFGDGIVQANANVTSIIAPSVDANDTPFTYTLEVIDEFGCTNSFQIEIVVDDSQFAIPNAFRPGSTVTIGEAPNTSTPNTTFYVITNPATEIQEFQIFNRWGEQVFEGNSENNNVWDGTVNGKPAPMDVYAYYVRVSFNDGTEREVRGEVTLIR